MRSGAVRAYDPAVHRVAVGRPRRDLDRGPDAPGRPQRRRQVRPGGHATRGIDDEHVTGGRRCRRGDDDPSATHVRTRDDHRPVDERAHGAVRAHLQEVDRAADSRRPRARHPRARPGRSVSRSTLSGSVSRTGCAGVSPSGDPEESDLSPDEVPTATARRRSRGATPTHPSADGRTASTSRVLPASASVSGDGRRRLARRVRGDHDRVLPQVGLPRAVPRADRDQRVTRGQPARATDLDARRWSARPGPAGRRRCSWPSAGRSTTNRCCGRSRTNPTPSARYFSSVMCRGGSEPGLPVRLVPTRLRHPGQVGDPPTVR